MLAPGTQALHRLIDASSGLILPDEQRPAFEPLTNALKQLSGVKVYKIGEVEKQVYVVGKTQDGKWAGVKTMAVAT